MPVLFSLLEGSLVEKVVCFKEVLSLALIFAVDYITSVDIAVG
jgi:hypothetical protein